MKMKLPVDAKTLKSAAKVVVAVGAGAVLAQAGSELAKRGFASVRDFASKPGGTNEAIVDTVAGLAAASAALVVYAKVKSPAAAKQVAPFVAAGAIFSAWAPVVAPMIAGQLSGLMAKIMPSAPALPGGYYRERFPGGVSGRDISLLGPGGIAGDDVRLARPGGVAGYDVPVHMPL